MRDAFPADLSDPEWALLARLLPAPKPTGRPRKWPDRLIADAVFYVLRSGCAWRMLPREFPPWPTVFSRFRRWRLDGTLRRAHDVLRVLARRQAGREPEPSAAVIDSPSAKTTGVGGPARGYDGAKRLNGRKRHILVDALGLVLAVCVHAADVQDREGARHLVGSVAADALPRLGLVWADQGYTGALADWLREKRGWRVEVVRHPARQLWRHGLDERPAHVPGAAAAVGGGAHVRLAGPVSPAVEGLRAAPGNEQGDDLRRDEPPHAPAAGAGGIGAGVNSASGATLLRSSHSECPRTR